MTHTLQVGEEHLLLKVGSPSQAQVGTWQGGEEMWTKLCLKVLEAKLKQPTQGAAYGKWDSATGVN